GPTLCATGTRPPITGPGSLFPPGSTPDLVLFTLSRPRAVPPPLGSGCRCTQETRRPYCPRALACGRTPSSPPLRKPERGRSPPCRHTSTAIRQTPIPSDTAGSLTVVRRSTHSSGTLTRLPACSTSVPPPKPASASSPTSTPGHERRSSSSSLAWTLSSLPASAWSSTPRR